MDYGMGNLLSIEKALVICGASVKRTDDEGELLKADAVVVPGVGAFGEAALNLSRSGLRKPILEALGKGRPFLGICLGFQLLFESSEESPGEAGLGYISGQVKRFRSAPRIPHIGWSQIGPDTPYYYFVHSYYPVMSKQDEDWTCLWSKYGERFLAGVRRKNFLAVQFHPEKSGDSGLAMLREFIDSI